MEHIRLSDFSGGMNNMDPAHKLRPNEGTLVQNVMLDGNGRLITRYAVERHDQIDNEAGLTTLASWNLAGTKKWVLFGYDGECRSASGNGSVPTSGWSAEITGWGDDRKCCVSYRGYLYAASPIGSTMAYTQRFDSADFAHTGLTTIADAYMDGTTDTFSIADSATAGGMEEKEYHYRLSAGYGADSELGIGYYNTTFTANHTVGAGKTSTTLTLPATGQNHSALIHIWRTYGGAGEGGPYYYVGVSAHDTTYNDIFSDYLLGSKMDKTESGYAPLQANSICVHGERMWYGGVKDQEATTRPMRVYYSEIGMPDYVPQLNYIEIPGQKGDEVLWLESYRGSLIIFTRADIWVLSGSSAYNFSLTRAATGVGCRSGYTVTNVEGELWYMGVRNVLAFNGSGVRIVTPRFDFTDYTDKMDYASACYDPAKRNYLLLCQDGSTESWVISVDTGAVYQMKNPTGIDYHGLKGGHFFVNPQPNDESEIYIIGFEGSATVGKGGMIYKLASASTDGTDTGYDTDGSDSSGVNISCTYHSPEVDAGDPTMLKMIRKGEAHFDSSNSPTTASLKLELDGTDKVTNSTPGAIMKAGGDETQGRRMQAEVTWTDADRVALNDVSISFTPLPPRLE